MKERIVTVEYRDCSRHKELDVLGVEVIQEGSLLTLEKATEYLRGIPKEKEDEEDISNGVVVVPEQALIGDTVFVPFHKYYGNLSEVLGRLNKVLSYYNAKEATYFFMTPKHGSLVTRESKEGSHLYMAIAAQV